MNVILLFGAVLLTVVAGHAESYCSLTVDVQVMGPLNEIPVQVQDADGHTEERRTRGGQVRFCGLGIGNVSVTVGGTGCRQLTVRDISLSWNKPTELKVVHDARTCNVESLAVAACQMLLRFVNDAGEPLEHLAFRMSNPDRKTLYADEYGRVFTRVRAYADLVGMAEFRGYRPQPLSVPCISQNYSFYKTVVLTREAPK